MKFGNKIQINQNIVLDNSCYKIFALISFILKVTLLQTILIYFIIFGILN